MFNRLFVLKEIFKIVWYKVHLKFNIKSIIQHSYKQINSP